MHWLLTFEFFHQVDKIVQVEVVDVLFIGPWDLGNSIGHPVTGEFCPELEEAIEKIRRATAAAGKRSGIYCAFGDHGRKYADQGFSMV